MEIYLVGGAVRDTLLGLPVTDHDWLVVGSTPEEMIALGFVPVGRDFPVFLHPQTHEEYALARTERKTERGYHGFAVHASPEVTLEEDLARRDLTINSIAIHLDHKRPDGTFGTEDLSDPYGGCKDLQARVLRHVTPAFREDPVRILRVARLAARLDDFSVAPETLDLMCQMVAQGEVDHLVAERVWQEISRGLMQKRPSRMLQILHECHALQRLLPEIAIGASLLRILDTAAQLGAPLSVRFACLAHWGSDSNFFQENVAQTPNAHLIVQLSERLRVPTECRELAGVLARESQNVEGSLRLNALGLVDLLERCDAIRKPLRFSELLLACESAARAKGLAMRDPWLPGQHLQAALALVLALDTAGISEKALAQGVSGTAIGQRIKDARVGVVAEVMSGVAGMAPGMAEPPQGASSTPPSSSRS